MANDVTTAFSDFGGAVSALFGARGSRASAASYDEAAKIASENATISKTATNIQEMQESRAIFKSLGSTEAQIGGAGFATSGTAIDLLRDSASQGALTKALTAAQGAITANSYSEQAGMYSGLAASARSSATGQTIGGVLQGASGLLSAAGGIKNVYDWITGGTTAATAAGSGTIGGELVSSAAGGTAAGSLDGASLVSQAANLDIAGTTVGGATGGVAAGGVTGSVATGGSTAGGTVAGASEAGGSGIGSGLAAAGPFAVAATAASILLGDMFAGDQTAEHKQALSGILQSMNMTPDQYAKYVVSSGNTLKDSTTLPGGYDQIVAHNLQMLGFTLSPELTKQLAAFDDAKAYAQFMQAG